MMPRFPLYIPTKGRADSRITSRSLDKMGVAHRLVIEEQEWKAYREHCPASKLLVLDRSYQENYETLDQLGLSKSPGPGPARNFIWEHSISEGYAWHWVMDDNIRDFFRLNRNEKRRLLDGTGFRCMEDFCLRFSNVAMAGPNYQFFVVAKQKYPPFVTNTRIYSCNLIRNDVPFRWRGRYNEDTILSLDMLKAGWCTIQFNAFLQGKVGTQMVKGGNTAEFYAKEGTTKKSLMQVKAHPDVSRMMQRFGRVHHYVDYSVFKHRLRRRDDAEPNREADEYGMKIVKR